jgi:hypothetical protein
MRSLNTLTSAFPEQSMRTLGFGIAAGQLACVSARGRLRAGVKERQRGEVSDKFGTVRPLSVVTERG